MARLGGNPELSKYQFTSERDEPLTEKFTLRVTNSMLTQLRSLDGNWREDGQGSDLRSTQTKKLDESIGAISMRVC